MSESSSESSTYGESSDSSGMPLDCEKKSQYRPGGYLHTGIGNLYESRYRIVYKLGFGYFSTVWLAHDHVENNFKALKINKSSRSFRQAALDEIDILTKIKKDNNCIHLYDNFEIEGKHGLHITLVTPVYGVSLAHVLDKGDKLPLDITKKCTIEILKGLIYLHDKINIVHSDLKPDNILINEPSKSLVKLMEGYSPVKPGEGPLLLNKNYRTLSKNQKKKFTKQAKKGYKVPYTDKLQPDSRRILLDKITNLTLIDFGTSCLTSDLQNYSVGTRNYRAPECILGETATIYSDMWALGCIIFEMLTNHYLFDPEGADSNDSDSGYDTDEAHLVDIEERIGPVPKMGSWNEYYKSNGKLKCLDGELETTNLNEILIKECNIKEDEAFIIENILKIILIPTPKKRITANLLLQKINS